MAQAHSGQSHIHQNPFLSLLLPFLNKVSVTVGELPGGQPVTAGWASLALTAVVVPALIFMRRRKQERE
jgi:hypothetical protein